MLNREAEENNALECSGVQGFATWDNIVVTNVKEFRQGFATWDNIVVTNVNINKQIEVAAELTSQEIRILGRLLDVPRFRFRIIFA